MDTKVLMFQQSDYALNLSPFRDDTTGGNSKKEVLYFEEQEVITF